MSKWELDQTYPETNKLIEIADYFNISLDELLRENMDDMESNQISSDRQIISDEASDKLYIHTEDNVTNRATNALFNPKMLVFIAVFLVIGFYCLETGRYSMLIAYCSSACAVWFVRFIKSKAK